MQNMFKKLTVFGVLLVVAVFAVACGADDNDGQSTESSSRDSIVVGSAAEVRSIDLHATNDQASAMIINHIFETLIIQDENMELHPGLALDWELVEEDRIWEFNLREDVYFHNGEQFTAHDVAFTFNRAAASPHVEAILGMVDPATIEVVDEHTVRVGTYEPFAPFLSHLAHSAAGIMNEVAVEQADDVERQPVGTGPFTLQEWTTGDKIVLERFEDYHASIPGFDVPTIREITVRQMPDPTSRLNALETGEIDMDLNPQVDNFSTIESYDNLEIISVKGLRTEYVGMNNTHPHLSNPLVRQAINYAIDVNDIVDNIYNSHGIAGATVVSGSVFGHNPNIEPFPYDAERARELMVEAGLEDGFSATIYANSERQDRVDIVTIVANKLAEIGINLEVQTMDWPTLLTVLDEGEADMFALGWTTLTGDADYGMFPLFHSSQQGPAGNQTFFANDDVDRLLDAARSSTDTSEREDYYFEAQEILREEAPWIIMLQEEPTIALLRSIEGFTLLPTMSHYFGNITFSE